MFIQVNPAYRSQEDYYNDMLSADEKEDGVLLEIVNHNLIVEKNRYYTKLSLQNSGNYLSLYADLNPVSLLPTILPRIEKVTLFSNIPLDYPYESIDEEQHLLMLKDPDRLVRVLER